MVFKKGNKHTEEHKEKIGLANKGKLKGKHNSPNTEFKKGQSGNPATMFQKGEKHIFWLGGKKPLPLGYKNPSYRETIRKRDNYRCQECFRHQDEIHFKNGKPRRLDVHHIDYDKKNNNPNNLISLCRNCHNQTDFDRDKWIDYFNDKMNGGK